MSQYRERLATARELADAVRVEQNRIEEQRRDAFLADKLFHTHIRVVDEFKEHADAITEEFLREKKGKSMIERFDLATNERFLGMVHVVELGVTTAPAADGELDDLKDEYGDLLDFLIDTKIVEREMTREESGRTLSVERTALTDDLVVVTRNRPLIAGAASISIAEGHEVPTAIGIAKRMVFSMPTPLYGAIAKRFNDPGLKSEDATRCVENLLERRDPSIGAIRTAYYLATELI